MNVQQYLLELVAKFSQSNRTVARWMAVKRGLDVSFDAAVAHVRPSCGPELLLTMQQLQMVNPQGVSRVGRALAEKEAVARPEDALTDISVWNMDRCVAQLHSWMTDHDQHASAGQPAGQGNVLLIGLIIRHFFNSNQLRVADSQVGSRKVRYHCT